jgi:uncharacterized protein (DUF305 family)
MNRILKIVWLIAALAITQSAFSQDRNASSTNPAPAHHDRGVGAHASANANKAPFDQQFLDTMSMHHQSGIQMAELVGSRSAHDELKTLAKKMIDEQQQDISKMQGLRKKWYGDQSDAANMHLPGMQSSMNDMKEKMRQLEASQGDAFDRMFIDMMVKHHQGAMKMASDAISKAQHSEVKGMAKEMRDMQKEEVGKLVAWKKAWHLTDK